MGGAAASAGCAWCVSSSPAAAVRCRALSRPLAGEGRRGRGATAAGRATSDRARMRIARARGRRHGYLGAARTARVSRSGDTSATVLSRNARVQEQRRRRRHCTHARRRAFRPTCRSVVPSPPTTCIGLCIGTCTHRRTRHVRSIDPLCRTTPAAYPSRRITPPPLSSPPPTRRRGAIRARLSSFILPAPLTIVPADRGTHALPPPTRPPPPASWTNCSKSVGRTTTTPSVALQVVSMDFSRGRH